MENSLLLALEKYYSYWAFFEEPYSGYIYIFPVQRPSLF